MAMARTCTGKTARRTGRSPPCVERQPVSVQTAISPAGCALDRDEVIPLPHCSGVCSRLCRHRFVRDHRLSNTHGDGLRTFSQPQKVTSVRIAIPLTDRVHCGRPAIDRDVRHHSPPSVSGIDWRSAKRLVRGSACLLCGDGDGNSSANRRPPTAKGAAPFRRRGPV